MKREILFRAKTAHGNHWIESHSIIQYDGKVFFAQLVIENDKKTIIEHEVIPKTVCQFINRLDKHGGKIFHNSRMKGFFWNKSTHKAKKKEIEFTVGFNPMIGFFIDCTEYGKYRFFPHLEDCEITGNINDHAN